MREVLIDALVNFPILEVVGGGTGNGEPEQRHSHHGSGDPLPHGNHPAKPVELPFQLAIVPRGG